MYRQWVGCNAANFLKGRPKNYRPEAIVLHTLGCDLNGARQRFSDPKSATSSHYAVGRDGSVLQFVEETDTAFHAGIVISPSWQRIEAGVNPNFYTIGIEFEGDGGQAPTDAQYGAAAELLTAIAERWSISLDDDRVVLHSEIRNGRECPCAALNRAALLARTKNMRAAAPPFILRVSLLTATRMREKPSTASRVLRVEPIGSVVDAGGFTDSGERIEGNSCWYQTADGAYFWAGATDCPAPEKPAPPRAAILTAVANGGRRSCGIPRIDNLMAGTDGRALTAGETDQAAVGAIQDLLTGHGFHGLPAVLSATYGSFGQKTADCVSEFQRQHSATVTGSVDATTLDKLVTVPAVEPRVNQVYLGLVLGYRFIGMHRILSLVAQMEGVGKFGALNLNTDNAGLSFGIIQWAQRPGRLAELLSAFSHADRVLFVSIFGSGDEQVADGLIAHLRRVSGGVNARTGETIDPAYDLVSQVWVSRFQRAARELVFQKAQVETALAAFETTYAHIRETAPELNTERAVAFLIDVANQFGNRGLDALLTEARDSADSPAAVLEAVAEESVLRMPDKFKAGVRARRDAFLHTALLADEPFARAAMTSGAEGVSA